MNKLIIIALTIFAMVGCDINNNNADSDTDKDPDPENPSEEVRDVAITEINAPEVVTQGEVAVIEVELENIGDTDITSSFTVLFTHHNIEEGSKTIDGLNAGNSTSVTFDWDTTDEDTGDPPHPLVFAHSINDDEESNNADSVDVKVELP